MDIKNMNRLQKENLCYQMRKEGKTFSEIGDFVSLSLERVRQLFLAYERREQEIENSKDVFLNHLRSRECSTARIENMLLNLTDKGLYDGNPAALANMGFREILKIKNIGRKHAKLIGDVLQEIGIINSCRDWMQPSSQKNTVVLSDDIVDWIYKQGLSKDMVADKAIRALIEST